MQGHNAFAMEVNDRSAALLGVEMRYPFFDRRLVEFCVALPAGQKLQAGWPRSILRRGMKGLLPPVVQWRSDKGNLSGGFHHGFHKDMPVVRQVIFDGGEAIAPYLDVPALRELYESYLAHNDDHDAFVLWRCVKIALWLRRCGFTSVS
jgi:asparagine synthase (glutamine-hydrolysing)